MIHIEMSEHHVSASYYFYELDAELNFSIARKHHLQPKWIIPSSYGYIIDRFYKHNTIAFLSFYHVHIATWIETSGKLNRLSISEYVIGHKINCLQQALAKPPVWNSKRLLNQTWCY